MMTTTIPGQLDGQTDIFDALGEKPQPPFTVHTSTQYRMQCGYCGGNTTSGQGNGGGCGKLPDGRWVMWDYCAECHDKHGRPDIATHEFLVIRP